MVLRTPSLLASMKSSLEIYLAKLVRKVRDSMIILSASKKASAKIFGILLVAFWIEIATTMKSLRGAWLVWPSDWNQRIPEELWPALDMSQLPFVFGSWNTGRKETLACFSFKVKLVVSRRVQVFDQCISQKTTLGYPQERNMPYRSNSAPFICSPTLWC